jgi:nucleotide-binding universal stress UspA family protein
MYDRILVPVDGSPGTEQVAAHAADLAETTGAEVHGIYVVDEKAVGVGAHELPPADVESAFRGSGEEALDRLRDVVESRDVDVEAALRHGTPHRAIVDYADEVAADVIVMGTHGRSGIERYILGSVTEHVIRVADQPVLAVKLDAAAVTDAEAAERLAEEALAEEDETVDQLREDPYRERSTWVVPVLTADGDRVNVHVDAVSGDTRLAHLDQD